MPVLAPKGAGVVVCGDPAGRQTPSWKRMVPNTLTPQTGVRGAWPGRIRLSPEFKTVLSKL